MPSKDPQAWEAWAQEFLHEDHAASDMLVHHAMHAAIGGLLLWKKISLSVPRAALLQVNIIECEHDVSKLLHA